MLDVRLPALFSCQCPSSSRHSLPLDGNKLPSTQRLFLSRSLGSHSSSECPNSQRQYRQQTSIRVLFVLLLKQTRLIQSNKQKRSLSLGLGMARNSPCAAGVTCSIPARTDSLSPPPPSDNLS